MGVAVTFIAILELLRASTIEVVQAEAFAPLHIRAASSVRLVSNEEDGAAESDEARTEDRTEDRTDDDAAGE